MANSTTWLRSEQIVFYVCLQFERLLLELAKYHSLSNENIDFKYIFLYNIIVIDDNYKDINSDVIRRETRNN